MESPFQSRRVVRRYCYEIDASPERIFPLLCPVREYDWIDTAVSSLAGATDSHGAAEQGRSRP
jgi:hypothetical protein